MGKFFDKFNKAKEVGVNVGTNVANSSNRFLQDRQNKKRRLRSGKILDKQVERMGEGIYDGIDDDLDDDDIQNDLDDLDKYDIGVQPSQKPESFHHFILENQYKDLERSIRGFKDVFRKDIQKWETKRKDSHCFTDEEAEEILRTAQSHLATDIKLSYINKEVFGQMMMAIYKQLDDLFYSIAEYRYGRYGYNKDGSIKKDSHSIQYNMKLQNRKIFLELWTRVQANYSRAIQGTENKATHGSVSTQESLQQSDRFNDRGSSYA